MRTMSTCLNCGKVFYSRTPSRAKNCSRSCAVQNRNFYGSANPKWRGGRIALADGRVAIYAPDHPNACLFGGTHILEYRLIAEQKIGRFLTGDEIVHHINGIITDNNPDNLEIMTQSEHARLHAHRDLGNGRFISPRKG